MPERRSHVWFGTVQVDIQTTELISFGSAIHRFDGQRNSGCSAGTCVTHIQCQICIKSKNNSAIELLLLEQVIVMLWRRPPVGPAKFAHQFADFQHGTDFLEILRCLYLRPGSRRSSTRALLSFTFLVLTLVLLGVAPASAAASFSSPSPPTSPTPSQTDQSQTQPRPHRYGGRATLFHRAILEPEDARARSLFEAALDSGSRVDDEDERRKTALHLAIERSDLTRAGWLLREARASPRIMFLPRSRHGYSPLWLAVSLGQLGMVRLLSGEEPLSSSERLDSTDESQYESQVWWKEGSSLEEFIITDAGNGEGVTPLAEAARLGHLPIVEYLLRGRPHRDQVCLAECRDWRGMSVWLQACAHGQLEVALRLVEEVEVRQQEMAEQHDGMSTATATTAATAGNYDLVKFLSHTDHRGMGCLLHAIQSGEAEFVRKLVEFLGRPGGGDESVIAHNENINQNNPNIRPNTLASAPGSQSFPQRKKALRRMLLRGMDTGETPLIAALRQPRTIRAVVAKTLLDQAKALDGFVRRPESPDKTAESTRDDSENLRNTRDIRTNHWEPPKLRKNKYLAKTALAKMLSARGPFGRTPLHAAASSGDTQAIEVVLGSAEDLLRVLSGRSRTEGGQQDLPALQKVLGQAKDDSGSRPWQLVPEQLTSGSGRGVVGGVDGCDDACVEMIRLRFQRLGGEVEEENSAQPQRQEDQQQHREGRADL